MNNNNNKGVIAVVVAIALIIGFYFLISYMENNPREDAEAKSYWRQKSAEERANSYKYKDKYKSSSGKSYTFEVSGLDYYE